MVTRLLSLIGWLGTALVFIFLAYGGWSDAATLAAEMRDGERGIKRADAALQIGRIVRVSRAPVSFSHTDAGYVVSAGAAA